MSTQTIEITEYPEDLYSGRPSKFRAALQTDLAVFGEVFGFGATEEEAISDMWVTYKWEQIRRDEELRVKAIREAATVKTVEAAQPEPEESPDAFYPRPEEATPDAEVP